jgi:hypothetical protein
MKVKTANGLEVGDLVLCEPISPDSPALRGAIVRIISYGGLPGTEDYVVEIDYTLLGVYKASQLVPLHSEVLVS